MVGCMLETFAECADCFRARCSRLLLCFMLDAESCFCSEVQYGASNVAMNASNDCRLFVRETGAINRSSACAKVVVAGVAVVVQNLCICTSGSTRA